MKHQLDSRFEALKFDIDEYKKPQLSMLVFTPMFDMWLEILKFRRGKLIERIMQRAHSPLRNWANTLYALFSQTNQTVIDTAGNSRTAYGTPPTSGWCNGGTVNRNVGLSLKAGADDDTFGLLAGYGTSPVTFDDHTLSSPYGQGSDVGQLDYGAVAFTLTVGGTVTIDTKTYNTIVMAIERPVTNLYAEPQTISEVGLVAYYWGGGVFGYKYLIFRDVLDTAITLASTESATLRYHLRWLLPA